MAAVDFRDHLPVGFFVERNKMQCDSAIWTFLNFLKFGLLTHPGRAGTIMNSLRRCGPRTAPLDVRPPRHQSRQSHPTVLRFGCSGVAGGSSADGVLGMWP